MSYRYLGNKTRLANWIVGIVTGHVPGGSTIADPMCGTASMSVAFARAGYHVIAGDTLAFPVLHARARLLTDTRAHFAAFGFSYEEALARLESLPPIPGFIAREYGDGGCPRNGAKPRRYFSALNSARIDAIRAVIKAWRAEGLHDHAADLLLHDLILAANRVANIAGTYGYYRATFDRASLASITLAPSPMEEVETGHRVVRGEAADTAAVAGADAIYLDPPYTKRQYGGNYHLPETLACEDEPEPAGEGGLRPWQPSAFCYRRRAAAAFTEILDRSRSRWVFVSYSEDAHLSETELLTLLRRYGKVDRHEYMLSRFRSNSGGLRLGVTRERLYVVERVDACGY